MYKNCPENTSVMFDTILIELNASFDLCETRSETTSCKTEPLQSIPTSGRFVRYRFTGEPLPYYHEEAWKHIKLVVFGFSSLLIYTRFPATAS